MPDAAPATDTKPRAPTYMKVVTEAMAKGTKAVEKMEPQPSKGTLARASVELRQLGKEKLAKEIHKLREQRFPSRKGRTSPQKGGHRDYSPQEQQGIHFVRIPVECIGGRKDGPKVRAFFKEDEIVLKLAPINGAA